MVVDADAEAAPDFLSTLVRPSRPAPRPSRASPCSWRTAPARPLCARPRSCSSTASAPPAARRSASRAPLRQRHAARAGPPPPPPVGRVLERGGRRVHAAPARRRRRRRVRRGAVVRSPAAPNRAAAAQQELRWEGGRRAPRAHLDPGVRGARRPPSRRVRCSTRRSSSALPPLGLLRGGRRRHGRVGAARGRGATPAWAVAPWAAALAATPVYVLAGLRAAGAPASAYRAMAGARAAGRREGPARAPDADLPRRHVGAHGACRPRAVAGGRRAASRPPASPPRASRPSPAARARRRRAGRAAGRAEHDGSPRGPSGPSGPARQGPPRRRQPAARRPRPRRRLPRRQPLRHRVRLRPGPGHLRRPARPPPRCARSELDANAVRVPLNESCWLGSTACRPGSRGAVPPGDRRVRRACSSATGCTRCSRSCGARPAAISRPTSPGAPDRDHSPSVWRSLARTFRHDHDVVLAPWGETVVDADCFLRGGVCEATYGPRNRPYATAGMQQAVDVMRRAGYTGVIAIPGVDRANDLSGWLAHEPRDPRHQLVAEAHVYGDNVCASTACLDRTLAPVAAARPARPRRDRRVRGGRGRRRRAARAGSRRSSGGPTRTAPATTRGPGTRGAPAARSIGDYAGTPHGAYGRWVEAHYSRSRVAPLRVRR